MVTAGPQASNHIAHLELRHRALALQRRRFWREVTYGALTIVADVLTLSAVFAVLGALPISESIGGLGEDGTAFVRGLIPHTPPALARRVTLLLFSLIVTRCYAHTERQQHPTRMAAALLLGLVLPRWVEVWTSNLPARWLLVGVVLGSSWIALVVQRRGLIRALRPIDPRRHEAARTLVVGRRDEVDRAVASVPASSERPGPRSFALDPDWPTSAADGM